MEVMFSCTPVGLTFDFPDFAEKVPEDIREQVLMTHLLPCVKVGCHVLSFLLINVLVKFSVGTCRSNINIYEHDCTCFSTYLTQTFSNLFMYFP